MKTSERTSTDHRTARDRPQPPREPDVAGGVRWLGGPVVESGSRGEPTASGRETVVLGSSHGPRLLARTGSSAAL